MAQDKFVPTTITLKKEFKTKEEYDRFMIFWDMTQGGFDSGWLKTEENPPATETPGE